MQSPKGRLASPGYSQLQIRLHWITVGLLAVQWVFSGNMPAIIDTLDAGAAPNGWQFLQSSIHVYTGLSVLGIVLVRLYLRRRDGTPPAPAGQSGVLHCLAKVTHYGLYCTLICMPITGALTWFGVLPAASIWHHRLSWVLILLIILHTSAALWHRWVKKDGVLARMLSSGGETPETTK